MNGKLYPEQSAMVVASGAAARLTPAGYEGSPALLAQLRALLLYCPNVVSLRLSNLELPELGAFVRFELGAIAPNLEVLDLSCAFISNVADLHAMLAALPGLRVLLFSGDSSIGNRATLDMDGGVHIDMGPHQLFHGMAEHSSLEYVRQGLAFVHFSAQLEPLWSLKLTEVTHRIA